MGEAVAVLGLIKDDFDWMTPVEYRSCVKAYYKGKEVEVKEQYELLRFHAWLILPTKSGSEPIDLVRFAWEKKEIKKGRVTDYGKTDSISEIKSTAGRGQ